VRYTYIFEPKALTEYKEAVAWYNERSETATKNLVNEVKTRIELICNDPSRYPNRYKFFRETSLKKYPYYIVYFTDDIKRTVVISSFYLHKRNPDYKNKR
jgi:plasmid stabilization system protein ParE